MSSEPISIAMVFRNMASPIISPVDIGERWPVSRRGKRKPINRIVRRLIL